MLVLTRKVSERFMIGDEIVITVVKIDGRQVRIGIEAPREVVIRRSELKTLFRHSSHEIDRIDDGRHGDSGPNMINPLFEPY